MSVVETTSSYRPSASSRLPLPAVFGCQQAELTAPERKFFETYNPFGFILFKRNCNNPDQVKSLVREMRMTVGRDDAPIFIDQEGGRVARLQPPGWTQYPAARLFGLAYDNDPAVAAEAVALYSRIVAHELAGLGISVNCAPVLDLFFRDATTAIGDRALSRKPTLVAELGRLQAEAFLENGILPVIKHFPGHGRLKVDPHAMLPVIEATLAELESDDFVPFDLLRDLPIGMNSHAVFTALDPHNPASLSPYVYKEIIRGKLGFDGLLLSDDICMKALHGTPGDLAKRVQAAGADIVLHCNAELEEMKDVAKSLQPISERTLERWEHARSMITPCDATYQPSEDIAQLDILLGGIAYEDKAVG